MLVLIKGNLFNFLLKKAIIAQTIMHTFPGLSLMARQEWGSMCMISCNTQQKINTFQAP